MPSRDGCAPRYQTPSPSPSPAMSAEPEPEWPMARRLERFSTMSVLAVDDNPANVELLRALLEGEGLSRVSTETDSRRVSDLLPSVNPDLVLLDLHMPHIDGVAVLEQITKFAAGAYLPVLVLTADVSSEARNRALAHGASDFLSKPLDLTEVTLRIANLLQTRQLYAALRRTERVDEAIPLEEGLVRDRIQAVLQDASVTPVFQPIVDIDTMTTVGHEALARFATPHERGPAGWFADALRVGLGVELEWLALTRALPFLDTASAETFLALNMSPATILHLRQQPLCGPELCPRIVVELTEHVPVEDYSALRGSLSVMREQGARLAADDLGSGYGGFRHLLALEPDIIKLDISIVQRIDRNKGARALASALVAFAADVGALVIAEGVEEAAELAELRDVGVHLAQGYYLGRPEPAAEGEALHVLDK
jgi:EAL domain-containing protein (putative c-di-GMP-specific phosphodiesterase class I)